MLRSLVVVAVWWAWLCSVQSLNMKVVTSRKAFLSNSVVVSTGALIASSPAQAATEVFQTPKGIKYAVLKKPKDPRSPQLGDFAAIEYTGYLTDGTIFDSTHSEGKQNALLFQVGGNAVIDGINELVLQMGNGEKVQAVVPPEFAFGDKGLCLENGECLIKPKSTLVYDIYLKKFTIPPP